MADLSETAAELESIARHLRRAGDTELVRELARAMRDGVRPVPAEIRGGLIPHLPDPYAQTLDADLGISVSVRTSSGNPGVSVTAKARSKDRKLGRLDAGLLTHPLFGDREHWFTQRVRPGWFTGPCQDAAPRVRAELEKALDEVSRKAVSKGSL